MHAKIHACFGEFFHSFFFLEKTSNLPHHPPQDFIANVWNNFSCYPDAIVIKLLILIRHINYLDAVTVECSPTGSPQEFLKLDDATPPFRLCSRFIFLWTLLGLVFTIGLSFLPSKIIEIFYCIFMLILFEV